MGLSTSKTVGVRLFLFIITAERTGSDLRTGRRTLLVFSRGDHPDAAMDDAAAHMHDLGWREVELQGAKELVADPATEKDPIASDAMRTALTEGVAYIVY